MVTLLQHDLETPWNNSMRNKDLSFNYDCGGDNNSHIIFTFTTTGTYYLEGGGYGIHTGANQLEATL